MDKRRPAGQGKAPGALLNANEVAYRQLAEIRDEYRATGGIEEIEPRLTQATSLMRQLAIAESQRLADGQEDRHTADTLSVVWQRMGRLERQMLSLMMAVLAGYGVVLVLVAIFVIVVLP